MSVIKVFFLAMILMSCGSATPHSDLNTDIASEFAPYVQEFEYQWKQRSSRYQVSNVTIRFKDRKPGVLGDCVKQGNKRPIVNIDPSSWKRLSESLRMILIAHELGHCVLHRDHVEQEALSIMTPKILSEKEFQKNKELIYDELFNPVNFYSWYLAGIDHKNCNHGE